jgi:diguanylate cyclase (GGDEF)-like protein
MDLFKREQQIYSEAAAHLKEIQDGAPCKSEHFVLLTAEYGTLLKQFRKIVRWSDRTATGLITDKNDLHDLSRHDALTGVYNRRFMEEDLERYLEFLSTSRSILSVLLIDVDFFKSYNDSYGHDMGDTCLKAVADVLADGVRRDGSFIARYGGDEFIAILSGVDANGARKIADRLLARVLELRLPHEASGAADFVTVSIGIAAGILDGMAGMTDYVKRADEALYISKQGGRNRWTCLALREEAK